jgi:hypothetical protein
MTDTANQIDAEVKARLSNALESFFKEERKLLESDVREDGLSHRLAVHIGRQFEEWDVDAEYDKMHIDGVPSEKKYIGADGKEHHAIPDIIVHRRQTMENFLAIEIKKLGKNRGREHDFAKLAAYKQQLGYQFAAFVEIGLKDGAPVFDLRFV